MITHILTDIEGTTTSVSFVYDVLFPYAREHMADFVAGNGDRPEVRAQLEAVAAEVGRPLSDGEAVDALLQWIDEDRKATPLKALQGLIWQAGYADGDYTGHIYADAFRELSRWRDQGLRLAVYSSGSVRAQQLLFGHSDFGDMTALFDAYFDTRVGQKREVASYTAIAGQLDVSPGRVLFLSDIEAELDAARDAGMGTCWLVRGSEPDPLAAHTQVAGFDAIEPARF
ncbi:MAG: acireductone synthase [Gammaproteobacteria bacterium]